MSSTFRTVDLFCGGGGLSQGLANAGFDVVAAFDWWAPALAFYNQNQKSHSAYKLDLADVAAAVAKIAEWKPTVIVGGPPCQDFSSAGRRDENGGRAELTTAYAEIVTRLRPPLFLMENVDRALKATTYQKALETFEKNGYKLAVAVLDASLCGVPQKRRRAVVVGSLYADIAAPLIAAYKTAQSQSPLTLRGYFGDSLGLQYYYRHPRSYARRGVFSIDEPSPTIRGVNRPIPKGYAGHPGDAAPIATPNLRPLTTKERSMVQTFPAEWELCGNKADLEQIIGNAVPVKLAEFVGRAIKAVAETTALFPPAEAAFEYARPAEPPLRQQRFVFEQKATYTV